MFVRTKELVQTVFRQTAHYSKMLRGSFSAAAEMDAINVENALRGAVKIAVKKSEFPSKQTSQRGAGNAERGTGER